MHKKTAMIKALCLEVGNCFGRYFEENNKFCIDNGEDIFRYDTEKELLADWVHTLVEHHIDNDGAEGANWAEKVAFIYEEIIGRLPLGIRVYRGKRKTTWKAESYINDGTPHGKMVYLGGFPTIIDAIAAMRQYRGEVKSTTRQLNTRACKSDSF